MFAKLLLLFTLVPALELFVLIPLASQIGVPATIASPMTCAPPSIFEECTSSRDRAMRRIAS